MTTISVVMMRRVASASLLLAPFEVAPPQRGAQASDRGPGAAITIVGPGPTNTITDVPGILVGQYERFGGGYRSGTTVITTDSARQRGPLRGMTAGYSQMGGAPGTRETDLLKPGGAVRTVQAIVLSGGSAFGLDAAAGVMRWMEERNFGYQLQ